MRCNCHWLGELRIRIDLAQIRVNLSPILEKPLLILTLLKFCACARGHPPYVVIADPERRFKLLNFKGRDPRQRSCFFAPLEIALSLTSRHLH